MTTQQDNFEKQTIDDFTEKAYLDYSMYVILDRALPSLADGLKPVHRRIVFAMSELSLGHTAKFKKSARTVGDVLGKYHPHGDSACYEAMVLMAQDFSYRYPLVDGQGNWGSPDDPKSYAAMRYTESRLTRYSQLLLSELGKGTVDWKPNFDGTLQEPVLMPARLPTILLNGGMGIAVGMATDIPPHNLREVSQATLMLLDNPDGTLEDIMEFIKGPDYPTDAEIISSSYDIHKAYSTGHGSIKMRAKYEIEDGNVIITALPHQVSGAKLLEQIASQMIAKDLPMIEDLRDESDHENLTRLVVIPKSKKVDLEEMMLHLFATTELEKSYKVNLNMIGLNGCPQVKNLKTILTEWLKFRAITVTRRLNYRLEKILARLHILEGLMVAFLNIDEVIAIIREYDEPKVELMSRFGISDIQAEAILDLKLRHLAKLEESKITGEQNELETERAGIEAILASKPLLDDLIRGEIESDMALYGDDRKSPIMVRKSAQALDTTLLISNDPVTIVLSDKGWVRGVKGAAVDLATLNYRAGDKFLASAQGRTTEPVYLLDSTGRVYSLPTHDLASAKSQGEPLTGRLKPTPGATFDYMVAGNPDDWYVLASDSGYGFRVQLKDLYTKNKAGKPAIVLKEGEKALAPHKLDPNNNKIVAVGANGKLLVFSVDDLPALVKGKGNKIISLKEGVKLVHLISMPSKAGLKLFSGDQVLSIDDASMAKYKGVRGRTGGNLPKEFMPIDSVEVVLQEAVV